MDNSDNANMSINSTSPTSAIASSPSMAYHDSSDSATHSPYISRRKALHPMRAVKPVDNVYERKALGIIPLDFSFKNNETREAIPVSPKKRPSTPVADLTSFGVVSSKFSFDPEISVNEMINKAHLKQLGLLAKKGVDDLNDEEFHLCTILRITPKQYLQAREVLLHEYQVRGFYKKSAAQKMLRMDVNKTGKLYDYFQELGWLPRM
ncbi:hypothetical protein ROZALSC1DRAFT_27312 [Rozella allomycis CSF55]|uniref:SWIRM domain-containing protein n=1 Tax=Rozella allomycis (strain CSF55) TaxID=988480 RepID=A0A075B5F0_ROZAC|nr:hypothetical protein O9G_005042 [Rozella allomycis CSF55]RKP21277.1 hypothetical protein ROZALSC1DRAFT_27312 [Rozella allomycis CSF55]|eukprot:EPZ37076.1 hypothetical protein O9G_005042 [Rozella allomycis CSF55]